MIKSPFSLALATAFGLFALNANSKLQVLDIVLCSFFVWQAFK